MVTITLTPEQENEVLQQVIAGRQTPKAVQFPAPLARQTITSKVLHYLNDIPKGKVFSPAMLAAEVGSSAGTVSGILSGPAKEAGLVEMVQRGTWKRL